MEWNRMKGMSLQEVWQSDIGVDGDRWMFQLRIYVNMVQMVEETHTKLPDERYQHGVFDTGETMQFNKDELSREAEQEVRGKKSQSWRLLNIKLP